MFIAFAIPGAAGVYAGLAVALHHLIVKPALFLLAERWGGSLDRLAGAARVSPLGAALFTLLSLSIIGVPPLPGFWAKLLVLIHLAQQDSNLYLLGAVAIVAGAALEVNYLFRVAASLYRRPIGISVPTLSHHSADIVVASLLGTALVTGTFVITPLGAHLQQIASQTVDSGRYVQVVNPGEPR
jgi:formate hydrogenlyase subunit 3/multisubunit Na+/H+ antiporter MnhD subunit